MKTLLCAVCFLLGLAACSATSSIPDEPLQERYWRLTAIDDQAPQSTTHQAEPHIVFGNNLRVHGSDGCNRFNGAYATTAGLRLGQLASTMMACPPPVDALARDFTRALAATASYRITGRQVELLDAEGRVRLRLEATFLK